MCHINIFIKSYETKGNRSLELCSFVDSATKNSYIKNDDGDGVYFSEGNFIAKSVDRISYLKFQEDISLSKFILSHQRITTSGFSEEYTQPFEDKEFILLHNGVLPSFAKKEKSDTFGLFNKFLGEFKKSGIKNRQKKVLSSIKKLFNGVSGSFSIGIFDKTTQKLYYFKNSNTNIEAFISEDKKEFYLTTSSDNEKLLELYRDDFSDFEIEDYKIYVISEDNEVKIKEVGELKEKESYKSDYYTSEWDKEYNSLGYNNCYDELEELEDWNRSFQKKSLKKRGIKRDRQERLEDFEERVREHFGFSEMESESCCEECFGRTTNLNNYGNYICDNCLFEFWKADKNERERNRENKDLETQTRENGIKLIESREGLEGIYPDYR